GRPTLGRNALGDVTLEQPVAELQSAVLLALGLLVAEALQLRFQLSASHAGVYETWEPALSHRAQVAVDGQGVRVREAVEGVLGPVHAPQERSWARILSGVLPSPPKGHPRPQVLLGTLGGLQRAQRLLQWAVHRPGSLRRGPGRPRCRPGFLLALQG